MSDISKFKKSQACKLLSQAKEIKVTFTITGSSETYKVIIRSGPKERKFVFSVDLDSNEMIEIVLGSISKNVTKLSFRSSDYDVVESLPNVLGEYSFPNVRRLKLPEMRNFTGLVKSFPNIEYISSSSISPFDLEEQMDDLYDLIRKCQITITECGDLELEKEQYRDFIFVTKNKNIRFPSTYNVINIDSEEGEETELH